MQNHGVTQKEIITVITHVAFYAGWPKAWAVSILQKKCGRQAKEIYHTKKMQCVRMQKRWYFQSVHQMMGLHVFFWQKFCTDLHFQVEFQCDI